MRTSVLPKGQGRPVCNVLTQSRARQWEASETALAGKCILEDAEASNNPAP